MTLNEWKSASSTLLYHRAMESLAASLMAFMTKIMRSEWHSPYAFWMSGYCSKRILARSFCRSVHLLADLKSRYLDLARISFLVSPLVYLYGLSQSFASSISSFACCMTSQRCLMRNSCTASHANFCSYHV